MDCKINKNESLKNDADTLVFHTCSFPVASGTVLEICFLCDGGNCGQYLIYACCKNNTTGGDRIKKSVNEKNDIVVTFTAKPDQERCVTQVDIYRSMNFTGTPVATSTFISTSQNIGTFTLPAGKTYYAKISSLSGHDMTGTFVAIY